MGYSESVGYEGESGLNYDQLTLSGSFGFKPIHPRDFLAYDSQAPGDSILT